MLTRKPDEGPVVQFYYWGPDRNQNIEMFFENLHINNGLNTVLRPSSNRARHLHLWLLNPNFRVVGAVKKGSQIKLTFKMWYVNESAVEDCFFTLETYLV